MMWRPFHDKHGLLAQDCSTDAPHDPHPFYLLTVRMDWRSSTPGQDRLTREPIHLLSQLVEKSQLNESDGFFGTHSVGWFFGTAEGT